MRNSCLLLLCSHCALDHISREVACRFVEEKQRLVNDHDLPLRMSGQFALCQLDLLVLLFVLEDLAQESRILEHVLVDASDCSAALLHQLPLYLDLVQIKC